MKVRVEIDRPNGKSYTENDLNDKDYDFLVSIIQNFKRYNK